MAYTYNDFLNAANKSGLLQQISESDRNMAKQYPEFGLSMLSLTKDLNNASTAEQKLLATEAADQLRGAYTKRGSSGNYYNDEINSLLNQAANYGPFNYGRENQYQSALDAVTNAKPFSYDLDKDIVWDSYRKQYEREGRRASEDTLAQISAATGGRPSSYAVTAAQQAADYYNSKLTDIIPTLFQSAYQRYLGDLQGQQAALSALQTDRNTAYGQHMDGYNMLLNNLGNYQNQGNTLYNRYLNQEQMSIEAEQRAQAQKQQQYTNALALYETLGYATPEIASILGISPGAAPYTSGGGNYSGGGGNSAGSGGNYSGGMRGDGGAGNGSNVNLSKLAKDTLERTSLPGTDALNQAIRNSSGTSIPQAGSGMGAKPTESANTRRFVSSHMTKEQARSRGITSKEYAAMVTDWLTHSDLDLTPSEWSWLMNHYGVKI